MKRGQPKIEKSSLEDAIFCLVELDGALERNNLTLARRLLKSLVVHSAWLSDYDDIFDCLDGKDPEAGRCQRWAKWQTGNLKLEQVIDSDSSIPNSIQMDRETKPYPNAVAEGLLESSIRATSERDMAQPNAPTFGTPNPLRDTQENASIKPEQLNAMDELDRLLSEISDEGEF